MSVSKYRIRPVRFICVMFILICVASIGIWSLWVTLTWAKNNMLLNLLDVRFLANNEIRKVRSVDGLLIRQEEPIKASVAGEFKLLVQDGDRLRVGADIAKISGVSDKIVRSPRAGIFCSHIDNLETLLNPDMIDVLDMGEVEKISSNLQVLTEEVDGGQIIGKVMDNLNSILVYIQVDNLEDYVARSFIKEMTIYLIYDGQELTGKVVEARAVDNVLNIFVEIEKYPDNFIHERNVQLELVTRKIKGWLIPEKAVVFKDGKPGIYVVSKQVISWFPVSVTDRLNEMVVVKGDHLSSLVRYVSNPGWAWEGARLDLRG